MEIILSIETSTSICSVALHKSGDLLSLREIEEKGAHAQKLIGLVDSLLVEQKLDIKELSAIAVSEGPGSYTGLRIGVSTAKGLAFSGSLPLIGVGALKALALGAKHQIDHQGVIVSMLDARRMEVYREVFDSDLNIINPIDAEIIDENSFHNQLEKGEVYFVGDAVDKVSQIISHPNANFLQIAVSADLIGKEAFVKYQNQEFEDLAYFVPNYLKEFKALHSKKNLLFS
jgi:tRNA threonylcarbamoyladenosine biosynthesis protein TsaB